MSDSRECQKCGDCYTPRPECEPTAYCDLCAQTMLVDLTKERDALRELLQTMQQLKAERDHYQKSNETHGRLFSKAYARAERAEAACAEMIDLLNYIDERILSPFLIQGDCQCEDPEDGPCVMCACDHAAKSWVGMHRGEGAGKGWLSPDKAKRLREALAEIFNDGDVMASISYPMRDRIKQALAETEEMQKLDNPEWDGTDNAHPAYFRGYESGAVGAALSIEKVLNGKDDVKGVCGNAHIQRVREKAKRLREALRSMARHFERMFTLNGRCLSPTKVDTELLQSANEALSETEEK